MPLILLILIVVLIAQIGFWDTLGALLGAVAMIVLLVMVAAATVAVAGFLLFNRARRRF